MGLRKILTQKRDYKMNDGKTKYGSRSGIVPPRLGLGRPEAIENCHPVFSHSRKKKNCKKEI
jgi:hypothetical protein